jgi:hypothetical protein
MYEDRTNDVSQEPDSLAVTGAAGYCQVSGSWLLPKLFTAASLDLFNPPQPAGLRLARSLQHAPFCIIFTCQQGARTSSSSHPPHNFLLHHRIRQRAPRAPSRRVRSQAPATRYKNKTSRLRQKAHLTRACP